MEDQVAKLNGLLSTATPTASDTTSTTNTTSSQSQSKDIAVFLGSGQTDPQAEQKALNGEYLFIYCTPEKLTGSGSWFLNELSRLHLSPNQKEIGLLAIDESHCVSEWGHVSRIVSWYWFLWKI